MPLDARDKITMEGLQHRFMYHAPRPDQIQQYQNLRSKALELAKIIVAECPSGSERSTALTHLDACIFFSNAAIARSGGEPEQEPVGQTAQKQGHEQQQRQRADLQHDADKKQP